MATFKLNLLRPKVLMISPSLAVPLVLLLLQMETWSRLLLAGDWRLTFGMAK